MANKPPIRLHEILSGVYRTRVFEVWCELNLLGTIRWYSQWRRYTFQPFAQTVFDESCLTEINQHLRRLMEEYRALRTGSDTAPQQPSESQGAPADE